MPEGEKDTRQKSRMEQNLPVEMPDVYGMDLITEYLDELGYAKRAMGELEPFSFQDVESWGRINGITDSWVLVMLVKMSREYAYQSSISRAKMCIAPYINASTDDVDGMDAIRIEADKKLRNMF